MKKQGFMCRTDYMHELGEVWEGCVIYSSVEDLKEHRKCVTNCGIVRVTVELEEVVEPGKGWSDEVEV